MLGRKAGGRRTQRLSKIREWLPGTCWPKVAPGVDDEAYAVAEEVEKGHQRYRHW